MDENTAYRLLMEHVVKPLGYDDMLISDKDYKYVRLLKYCKALVCFSHNNHYLISKSYADAFRQIAIMLFHDENDGCFEVNGIKIKKSEFKLDVLKFDCSLLGIDVERL